MVIIIMMFGIITISKHLNICFLQGITLGTVEERNRHKCLSAQNSQIYEVLAEFTLETFLIKW